jgi:hypothetical protein
MAWAGCCLMWCCLPARVFFRSLLGGIRSCLGSPRRDEAHQRKCFRPFRHMASRLGLVKRELLRGALSNSPFRWMRTSRTALPFDGAVAPPAGPSNIGPRSYMTSDNRFLCSSRLERDPRTISVGDDEDRFAKHSIGFCGLRASRPRSLPSAQNLSRAWRRAFPTAWPPEQP